jgi:DNA-binding HxlR family transcriptional regulator
MAYDSIKPLCNEREEKPGCIEAALCVLGDKWTPLLLGQLMARARTFGELEAQLNGISPRTLSSRLSKLEEYQIVTKNKYNEHPPRYKYQLTTKGSELQQVLQGMAIWSEKYV